MGLVDFDEPFTRLFNQGIIIAEKQKMSKSRGNVINPDEYVSGLGADVVRAYLMFVAPWEQGGEWDDSGISGVSRWLNRVWELVVGEYRQTGEGGSDAGQKAERELSHVAHQAIRKATGDMEGLRFNTLIAALMGFANYLAKVKEAGYVADSEWREAMDTLLLLMAPVVPHLAEELWQRMGHGYSIHNQSWPRWDAELAEDEEITLVVQINGKLRDRIIVPASITEAEARQLAVESKRLTPHLEGKDVLKTIYVPGRLVNLVVR
jgi:leucyl-tRNA synthetase